MTRKKANHSFDINTLALLDAESEKTGAPKSRILDRIIYTALHDRHYDASHDAPADRIDLEGQVTRVYAYVYPLHEAIVAEIIDLNAYAENPEHLYSWYVDIEVWVEGLNTTGTLDMSTTGYDTAWEAHQAAKAATEEVSWPDPDLELD